MTANLHSKITPSWPNTALFTVHSPALRLPPSRPPDHLQKSAQASAVPADNLASEHRPFPWAADWSSTGCRQEVLSHHCPPPLLFCQGLAIAPHKAHVSNKEFPSYSSFRLCPTPQDNSSTPPVISSPRSLRLPAHPSLWPTMKLLKQYFPKCGSPPLS